MGGKANGTSEVNEYSYKENYYTTNIYSDYFKQFDNGHYFKVMAGFNSELYKTRYLQGQKTTLISNSVPTINTATDDPKTWGGYAHNAVAGFFGRINYNYKDRYMIEANGRYDGSSRFIGDKRWGFFLHSLPDGTLLRNHSSKNRRKMRYRYTETSCFLGTIR